MEFFKDIYIKLTDELFANHLILSPISISIKTVVVGTQKNCSSSRECVFEKYSWRFSRLNFDLFTRGLVKRNCLAWLAASLSCGHIENWSVLNAFSRVLLAVCPSLFAKRLTFYACFSLIYICLLGRTKENASFETRTKKRTVPQLFL